MAAFSKRTDHDHTVIFFHIPKTAGATFAQVIERQYPPAALFTTDPERHWASLDQFRQLPESRRREYRAISGHMYFGIHEALSQPYSYITLLRDPIERIISYYYFILRYPGHYLYETLTARQMSLQALVSSGLSKEFDNLQTRLLSGVPKIGYGECSTTMLERAKSNLENHFRFAGTTKHFDEFLLLVSQAYGWRFPFYLRKHVAQQRPQRQAISKETLHVIEKYHELDIALYQHVAENFKALLAQQGAAFEQALKRFKLLNTVYTFSHPVIHKIERVRDSLAG